jgi:hypothetical protein
MAGSVFRGQGPMKLLNWNLECRALALFPQLGNIPWALRFETLEARTMVHLRGFASFYFILLTTAVS